MDSIQIVRDYYKGWEEKDQSKIRLAEHVVHTSPNGVLKGRDTFLNLCWEPFSGIPMQIQQIIADGNTVCVRYETVSPQGNLPVTEWVTLNAQGEITDVKVYFDRPPQVQE